MRTPPTPPSPDGWSPASTLTTPLVSACSYYTNVHICPSVARPESTGSSSSGPAHRTRSTTGGVVARGTQLQMTAERERGANGTSSNSPATPPRQTRSPVYRPMRRSNSLNSISNNGRRLRVALARAREGFQWELAQARQRGYEADVWDMLHDQLVEEMQRGAREAAGANAAGDDPFAGRPVPLPVPHCPFVTSSKDLLCSICQHILRGGVEATSLPCHHWFHRNCAEGLIRNGDWRCPNCRADFNPY